MFYFTKTPITKLCSRCGKLAALALAAMALVTTRPAVAEDQASPKSICLDVNRIDHTQVLNNHQILFYMLGHKVWVNTLQGNCATLTPSDGFIWESRIARYCDNLETIRVIRTGETCLLGAFTPYVKPGAS